MEDNKILLNDILNIDNIDNSKIRFNLQFNGVWNPIEFFKNGDISTMLSGLYWNYKKKKSFRVGQVVIGFVKLAEKDLWLLFHIGEVTKDLDVYEGVGYEYKTLERYEKYFGRLIVRFKNPAQALIRLAKSVIDQCEVVKILPDLFDNDIFPGYDRVGVTWEELSRVITKENWRTALRNQKAIYLIVDKSNGKMYVGSAYGDDMLLGRWETYVKTPHGGNKRLRKLPPEHIKQHFKYSILDIYKNSTADELILSREAWWKNLLMTREFGYNDN